jgi:hypothetical protein
MIPVANDRREIVLNDLGSILLARACFVLFGVL